MIDHSSTAGQGSPEAAPILRQFFHACRSWISGPLLVGADFLSFSLIASVFRAGRAVPQLMFFTVGTGHHAPIDIFYVLGALFVLVRYVSGDYRRRRLFWDSARDTTVTALITSIPCFIIIAAYPAPYSYTAEISSWPAVMLLIPLMRYAVQIAMSQAGLWRVPTAIVAVGSCAPSVYEALSSTVSLGYDIRWLAYDGPDIGLPLNRNCPKELLDRAPDELVAQLSADGCAHAVVTTDDIQSPRFADTVRRLIEARISVAFVPSFRRLPLAGVTSSYLFGRDILLFQVRGGLQSLPQHVVKRAFDILASSILLIIFAPFFAFIAFVIKRYDGGKIIYGHKRAGRHGEPFFCLKFRSMAVDAEERLERWQTENPELYEEFTRTYKLPDDPRITPPGKWLRKSSLDELPQLLNVLRGEMSLVGPRPVTERELIEHYGSAAQLYRSVRPGLTGLWQISGRSNASYEERIVYDEWYILNWTLWYDIVIAFQTALTVLKGKGAY